jgi:CheY-like chemotaxis protein
MGRRILMDAGYEVVTVNNGSAALKKIHENHPDLIVLDVYMPGYGGLEVCQRLKEAADTARIPVLLSVGKMEPFKAEEAKRVRADGHIVKPFEASELLAALTKLEDRIVPQPDAASAKRGKLEKPEKKSRLWHGGDPLAGAEEVPTERVAYLEEVKKRRAHKVESAEAEAESSEQSTGGSAAEMPSPAAVERPVAAASAATEEFAVQESVVPSESDSQNAVEIPAAEAVAEVPPIFEAPTVEIPAAEIPADAGVAANESPENQASENQATVSTDSVAMESIPEVAEANVQPSDSAEAPAATVAATPVSAARWIAENVALSVEEASIALEAEMQQAHAASAVPVNQPGISAPEPIASSGKNENKNKDAAQPAPETENVNSSGAAFAAAASASGQPSAVSTQPASANVEGTASVPEVGPNVVEPNAEPEPPSDATAAWANWQQIRDSVMSPQKAAEIAESMAAIAHAGLPIPEPAVKEDLATKQDSAPSDNVSAAPAEPATEDNSINDIVDSVLADLKPRLMQEIAKKLAAKK